MNPPVRRRVLIAIYVLSAAMLAAISTSPDHRQRGLLWAAMLTTAPATILMLPVLYIAGGEAWHLSHADNGGPLWPVRLVYGLIMGCAALLNVILVRSRVAARRGQRERLAG
jgi:hypothetical protein